MGRILWIDDYAGKGRKSFDLLLFDVRRAGHEVVVAATPRHIAETLESVVDFDVVVLDVLMRPLPWSRFAESDCGGLDVLDRIVAIDPRRRPRVVILSLLEAAEIKQEAMERGIELSAAGVAAILNKSESGPGEIGEAVLSLVG